MPCLICPRVPLGEVKSCLSAPPDQQVSPSACPSAFGSSATAAFCRLFHCLHICEYKFVSLLLFCFFRSRGSVVLCNVAQRPRCITAIHLKPQRQTGPFFLSPLLQISRPLHISTRPEEPGFIFSAFCDASDHLMARAARECDGQVCRGRSRVGGDGCRCCCCCLPSYCTSTVEAAK